MNDNIQNQMMYLAAREFLCRLLEENKVEKTVIDILNRKNAEMLMCDLLPIE